jgi:hypothetical protein
MKILDLALNALILASATIFLAYIGLYYFDYGIFTSLPEGIVEFFARNGALQYVALALLAAALIAKVPVGRALERQKAERKI